MNINLHVKFDGVETELFQTPTFISHMCMVQSNGEIKYRVTGDDALRALQSYLQWVKSKQNGVYNNGEVLAERKAMVNMEVRKIIELIRKSNKIEVYIM